MNIQFESQLPDFQINNTYFYRKVLTKCAEEEHKKINYLIYHFVSDEVILNINSRFLNHQYITDVITFNNSFLETLEGEIFICVDEVRRNAKKHAKGNFNKELNRVILHGMLHLIGYNDQNVMETLIMREKESYYLGYF